MVVDARQPDLNIEHSLRAELCIYLKWGAELAVASSNRTLLHQPVDTPLLIPIWDAYARPACWARTP